MIIIVHIVSVFCHACFVGRRSFESREQRDNNRQQRTRVLAGELADVVSALVRVQRRAAAIGLTLNLAMRSGRSGAGAFRDISYQFPS